MRYRSFCMNTINNETRFMLIKTQYITFKRELVAPTCVNLDTTYYICSFSKYHQTISLNSVIFSVKANSNFDRPAFSCENQIQNACREVFYNGYHFVIVKEIQLVMAFDKSFSLIFFISASRKGFSAKPKTNQAMQC